MHVSSLIPCHAFSLIVLQSVIAPFIKQIDRQQIAHQIYSSFKYISFSNIFFSYTGDRNHDHPATDTVIT